MNILRKYIIISSILFGCLYVGILILMFHRYYVKKKEGGMKTTTIKRPIDVIGRKIATYIILLIFLNVRIPSDMIPNDMISNDMRLLLILPVIFSFIALVLLAWFDLQPQQIYQNGILVSTGFIKWSEIKCAESLDDKERVVKVTLNKSRFGSNTIKLSCFLGLASNFVELISANIQDD